MTLPPEATVLFGRGKGTEDDWDIGTEAEELGRPVLILEMFVGTGPGLVLLNMEY